MSFCARQLMEKAREHKTELYMMFVDLRKAHDSVPRQALWLVLQKYGVPPQLIWLIQSLHEGMKAEASVDGATSPYISACLSGSVSSTILQTVHFASGLTSPKRRCCLGTNQAAGAFPTQGSSQLLTSYYSLGSPISSLHHLHCSTFLSPPHSLLYSTYPSSLHPSTLTQHIFFCFFLP